MPLMITDEHINELRRRIDEYSKRVSENPGDRLSTIILDATLRNYEAKLKLKIQDDHTANASFDVDY